METKITDWFRSRQCYICKDSFQSVSELEKHLLVKHPEFYKDTSKYLVVCGETSSSVNAAEDIQFIKQTFLNNVSVEYFAFVDDLNLKSPDDLFSYVYGNLVNILSEELIQRKSYKASIYMEALFSKVNPETNEKEFTTPMPIFRSFQHAVLNQSMIPKLIDIVSNKFLTEIEYFNLERSGWNIEFIASVELKIINFKPLKASSYVPTPLLLKMKESSGCILNVKNDEITADGDHLKCFAYSILSSDFIGGLAKDKNRHVHWQDYKVYKQPDIISKVNFDNIGFPIDFSRFEHVMNKFHEQNPDISLTIIGYHEDEEMSKNVWKDNILLPNASKWGLYKARQTRILKNVFPLYIFEGSERKFQIDLLLVISPDYTNSHFMLIRNLTSFLRLNKTTNYICRSCLSQFHSPDSFQQHKLYCFEKQASISFPKNPIMKFQNYKQMVKVPFCYYLDFEAYLKKPDSINSSYKILQTHVPCAYSFYCLSDNGEKVSSKTYVQQESSENVVKTLLVDLMEDVTHRLNTLIEYQKNSHNTMDTSSISMTDILNGESSFTHCYFCEKRLTSKDFEKKVAYHHSHTTRQFLGVACNDHNLAARIQPFLITIVLHNGSCYDFEFIIEQLNLLGISNIDIIPKTSQKFLVIICNITRNGFHAQLRFIDSFQFLSTSLSNLCEVVYDNGNGRDKFKLIYDEFANEIDNGLTPDDLFHKSLFPYQLLTSFQDLLTFMIQNIFMMIFEMRQ